MLTVLQSGQGRASRAGAHPASLRGNGVQFAARTGELRRLMPDEARCKSHFEDYWPPRSTHLGYAAARSEIRHDPSTHFHFSLLPNFLNYLLTTSGASLT
eukprot:2847176-Pleurochrysis_carterae.AAC.3